MSIYCRLFALYKTHFITFSIRYQRTLQQKRMAFSVFTGQYNNRCRAAGVFQQHGAKILLFLSLRNYKNKDKRADKEQVGIKQQRNYFKGRNAVSKFTCRSYRNKHLRTVRDNSGKRRRKYQAETPTLKEKFRSFHSFPWRWGLP